ncbi:PASTA domain-containing protein [Nocardioides sp. Y6]|uniref:PASTA domain-containing protein n=1 Tax=Nocardioides malaquae TaxID=2773426 RepID=A0ABR9RWF9_9ACTN|nr:PASTA domain-containing protein [Nocardioides malaquae]MBE7325918.1 PASTA domain-containing protein [Nocardioides malaquae]
MNTGDVRWVGIGRVAVAVPEEWGTNELRCGTPVRDTVIVDVAMVELCHLPRPPDVDSLEFGQGSPPGDVVATEVSQVDGVQMHRGQTDSLLQPDNGVRVWSSTVSLPGEGLWIRAESSRGPEQVNEVLGRVSVLRDGIGIPPRNSSSDNERDEEQTGLYAQRLLDLGLEVTVERRVMEGPSAGHLLKVSPQPGTVVPEGTRVVLTVVGD